MFKFNSFQRNCTFSHLLNVSCLRRWFVCPLTLCLTKGHYKIIKVDL
jgi:hypothetical protein